MEEGTQKRRRTLRNFLLLIGFLIGAGITFYPLISRRWNAYRDSLLITEYEQTVANLTGEDVSDIWRQAREYNDQHSVNTIYDAFGEGEEDYILTHPYDTLLNPLGDEVMGYLEIPKIDVDLPIYHGTGKKSLEKGVGHIEGTSLPVGGAGTHTVLSGHRGLPNLKLLTDLDQIVEGDLFYLHILDETLAYRVIRLLTVLPEEPEALAIDPEKDMATLITCTPYGVNTHRLLVQGERAEYSEGERQNQRRNLAERVENVSTEERILLAGLGVFAFFVLLFWMQSRRRERKRQKEEE